MVAPLRLGFPQRVDQTYMSDHVGRGSCLQAAVATIFGLDLNCVPDLRPNNDLPPQKYRLVKWLQNNGWSMIERHSDQPHEGYYLACGLVERSIYIPHAVVMCSGVLYHDPHPCRKGLAIQQRVLLFYATPYCLDIRYAS